jgi:uncharacterized protein (DUF1778 family)
MATPAFVTEIPARERETDAVTGCENRVAVKLSDAEARSLLAVLESPPVPPNAKFVELFKRYG